VLTRPIPGPLERPKTGLLSRHAYFVLYVCRSGTTELMGAIFILLTSYLMSGFSGDVRVGLRDGGLESLSGQTGPSHGMPTSSS
jgi:hypothetical protein